MQVKIKKLKINYITLLKSSNHIIAESIKFLKQPHVSFYAKFKVTSKKPVQKRNPQHCSKDNVHSARYYKM